MLFIASLRTVLPKVHHRCGVPFLLVIDKDRKRRESTPAPDLWINGERLKTLDINDACR